MLRTQIKEALEAKRAEAQQKWGVFEKLRDAMQEAGVDPLKDKDAFEKAHEAQKDYALVKSECDELFGQYEKAVEMDGTLEPRKTPFSDDDDHDENGNGNGKVKSAGEMFADSAQMKQLRESGVLSMEKAHVHSGPVEVISRDLVKTLLTGGGAPGTRLASGGCRDSPAAAGPLQIATSSRSARPTRTRSSGCASAVANNAPTQRRRRRPAPAARSRKAA
jgi:hypothetical protein